MLDSRLHIIAVMVIMLLAVSPFTVSIITAYANGEDSEEEKEGGEGENEFAKSLGEFAWSVGPVLIVAFVIYKYTLPYQARLGLRLPVRFKHVLDMHIYTSIILGIVALTHGYLLMDRARLLEYLIGAVIVFMMVTGVLLRWSRDRRARMFARLIHTQRLLALTLLVLILIHTATMED